MIRAVLSAGPLLLLTITFDTVQAWKCHLPAGNYDNVGMTPCNATLADTPQGSACCDPRDACTTSGMCLGASKYTYRGGCTDPTFAAGACPSMCLIDPVLQQKYSKNPSILNCDTPGIWSSTVCCQSFSMTSGNPMGDSCCNSSFQYTQGASGLSFRPGWDTTQALLNQGQAALAQLNSTNSTNPPSLNSSSSLPAPSSSSSHNDHLSIALGIGLGVPGALLVAGLLSFLFYKERNKHARELAAASSSSNASLSGRPIRSMAAAATSPISEGSGTYFSRIPPSRSTSSALGTKTDVYASSPGAMGYLDRKGSLFGAGVVGQMGGMVMGSPKELSGEDKNETFSTYRRYEVPG